MCQPLVSLGSAVLLVVPCALCLLAVGVLADRTVSFARTTFFSAGPDRQEEGSLEAELLESRTPERSALKVSPTWYSSLALAAAVHVGALSLMTASSDNLSESLPSVLWILPNWLTAGVPELVQSFLGTTTAIGITSVALHGITVGIQHLIRDTSAA